MMKLFFKICVCGIRLDAAAFEERYHPTKVKFKMTG